MQWLSPGAHSLPASGRSTARRHAARRFPRPASPAVPLRQSSSAEDRERGRTCPESWDSEHSDRQKPRRASATRAPPGLWSGVPGCASFASRARVRRRQRRSFGVEGARVPGSGSDGCVSGSGNGGSLNSLTTGANSGTSRSSMRCSAIASAAVSQTTAWSWYLCKHPSGYSLNSPGMSKTIAGSSPPSEVLSSNKAPFRGNGRLSHSPSPVSIPLEGRKQVGTA
mmetsp:Transcript_50651/g.151496  ORF Transcript_50651/g.151496 Transcript_50651/m.151496 type:complete len:225 (-) Transcript_50651:12-686(-)